MTQQPPEDELDELYDPLEQPDSFEPKPIYTVPEQEDFDEDDS